LKQTAGKNVFETLEKSDWKGVKIGVFSVCSSDGGRLASGEVADALAMQGARVLNVLSLKVEKSVFSKGGLSETDLARAHGFGERTTNNAKQVVVRKDSEKKRIRGYG
jgi:flavodoxin